MNETTIPATPKSEAPHWTFSILHAAHMIEDRIEESLGKVGLSMAKQGALTELTNAGEPLTLSQLAARLSCVRSNMTQLIDRLESDGLVTRLDDPSDRRSIRAELTPKGRERQRAGEKAMKKAQAEVAGSFSAKDRSALEAALVSLK